MKKVSKFIEGWKNFAHKIAKAQTFLLMFLFYFLIVPLFSVLRLRDPLKLRFDKKKKSYWEPKKKLDTTLDGMRLPY